MSQDLRSYLDLIKQNHPDDFLTVSREVDPAFEITAITVKLEQEAKRRPILLFQKVKGTSFPVLTNLHAGRSRLAAAIHAEPEDLQRTYLQAMEKPISPKVVSQAPVKDVILTGDQVDLYKLPQIHHHQEDAGAYITAAISFAKDPNGDSWNCAYNRLMIKGRDTTSIHLTSAKHLWEFQRAAEAQNKPLPVTFAIGVHPAIALGCLAIGSIDEDERGIMGGLLGEPLELVKCETSDLLVPAHAEIILEGEILPHERTAEGPFGEFTGYASYRSTQNVFVAHRVRMRKDAMYHSVVSGMSKDHILVSCITREGEILNALKRNLPNVKAVHVPHNTCGAFMAFISMKKTSAGEPQQAIMAALGTEFYTKYVIVVDDDVDVFNLADVMWAVATRVRAEKDIVFIPGAKGAILDPTSDAEDFTLTKMGIDATKPLGRDFAERLTISEEQRARVRGILESAGVKL